MTLGITRPKTLVKKANPTSSKLCLGYFFNKTKTLADGGGVCAGFDMGKFEPYVADYTKNIDIMIDKIRFDLSTFLD